MLLCFTKPPGKDSQNNLDAFPGLPNRRLTPYACALTTVAEGLLGRSDLSCHGAFDLSDEQASEAESVMMDEKEEQQTFVITGSDECEVDRWSSKSVVAANNPFPTPF